MASAIAIDGVIPLSLPVAILELRILRKKNMTEIIFVVEEAPEGGYQAKALGTAIFTEGENLEELKQNIKEAIHCHFEEETEKPKMVRLHLVKEEVFAT